MMSNKCEKCSAELGRYCIRPVYNLPCECYSIILRAAVIVKTGNTSVLPKCHGKENMRRSVVVAQWSCLSKNFGGGPELFIDFTGY